MYVKLLVSLSTVSHINVVWYIFSQFEVGHLGLKLDNEVMILQIFSVDLVKIKFRSLTISYTLYLAVSTFSFLYTFCKSAQ